MVMAFCWVTVVRYGDVVVPVDTEVRLYLIILQCLNKHQDMLEVLSGPLAGQLMLDH